MGLEDDKNEEAAKSVITGARIMAARRLISLRPPKHGHSKTDNNRSKTRVSTLKDCDEDKLLSYLTELQQINPENVYLAKQDNASSLCK
jgi:hypothetical protein